jgi:hypothetical protein
METRSASSWMIPGTDRIDASVIMAGPVAGHDVK